MSVEAIGLPDPARSAKIKGIKGSAMGLTRQVTK